MAVQDFWPFSSGQKVTAAQWNELLTSIQDGSFFLDTSYISTQIMTLADRVEAIELRMDILEQNTLYRRKTQQIQLTDHQVRIELEDVPRLDSEIVALNGTVLSKNGIPLGFIGDYSIENNVITLSSAWQPQIVAGDMLVVNFEFEVTE